MPWHSTIKFTNNNSISLKSYNEMFLIMFIWLLSLSETSNYVTLGQLNDNSSIMNMDNLFNSKYKIYHLMLCCIFYWHHIVNCAMWLRHVKFVYVKGNVTYCSCFCSYVWAVKMYVCRMINTSHLYVEMSVWTHKQH